MLKEAILKVVTRQDLTEEEMTRAMEVIRTGEATGALEMQAAKEKQTRK